MSDINVIVNDEIVNIEVIDEPVLVNVVNSPGVPGAPGQGVPVGGTTGQVLAKSSATNYDTAWVNVSGGTWGSITGTLSNQTDLQTALDAKFDDPTGTTAQYLRGDGSLATFPSLTGFVPYTGATGDVNLGTHRITAQNATISSSGSGDTATITHSSGSGIGLNITKGGNGEGLYINKTGGSGNAATIIGTINATTLVKSGGTSSQFLKADGTVDSSVYVPTSRELTINGVTFDLSANRTFTVGSVTGSGASGQVAYWTGTSAQSGTNDLFWDSANGRLGIGTDTPSVALDVVGDAQITSNFTSTTVTENGLYLKNTTTPNFGSTNVPPSIILEGRQRGGSSELISKTRISYQTFLGGTLGGNFSAQFWNGTSYANIFNISTTGLVEFSKTADAATEFIGSGNAAITAGRFIFRAAGPVIGNTNNSSIVQVGSTYNNGSLLNRNESAIRIASTINQTLTATGVYRGLFVNPTLTSITSNDNWRSVEWSNNTGWGLFGAGTAANYMAGNLLLGSTTNSGERLQVTGNVKVTGNLAVDTNTLFVDATNDRIGIGTASPAYPLEVISTGASGTFNLSGRFVQLSTQNGTGAGTTGSGVSYRPLGNQGAQVLSYGVNTGQNIGGTYLASNGNTNIGGWFGATVDKNSAQNIGIASFALNNGTSPTQVAGYFALADYGTSLPTFTNAALIADNGATTSPIFLARDNGSTVFTIADGGNVGIGNTPTAAIDIKASTTSAAAMRFRSGTAPTSPNDGDIWFDGTDIKMRIGGVTKTFTLL